MYAADIAWPIEPCRESNVGTAADVARRPMCHGIN